MIEISLKSACRGLLVAGALGLAIMPAGQAAADEEDAKRILKAMSDYMAAQTNISFDYDSSLEVVTTEGQTLAIANSGTVTMERPDKLRATRVGGFADVEFFFDGESLTMLGKNENIYVTLPIKGTIHDLVEDLRVTYHRPMPAGDLLTKDSYDALMDGVTDIKDLGSGFVGGVECDSLAFRSEHVDWQIWIAHGDEPYPCRYSIISRDIKGSPQYTVQVRNFKAGGGAEGASFAFDNDTDAAEIVPADLEKRFSELPGNFKMGAKE
ncbi:DUF2092 domain-containing protein [Rhodobacteraceae bacterium NNCM2]|nr:DUF2092 domain-containing protein [Coraliihabitans acroporae]